VIVGDRRPIRPTVAHYAPSVTSSVVDRPAQPKPRLDGRMSKSSARRDELAESTLKTLAELGYARTSLREIAQNSDFSHGVLHYYFRDKVELILHGVRRYKAQCVNRYDDIVEASTDADELRLAFAWRLAETVVEDALLHRLWYDLRTQSMFESGFRDDVVAIDVSMEAMVWRVVERYGELAAREPVVRADTAYSLIDGLFAKALRDHLAGDPYAPARLGADAARLLPVLLGDPLR
jgi:AcrR family transcriptional regulator